jgi:hypothetical protein
VSPNAINTWRDGEVLFGAKSDVPHAHRHAFGRCLRHNKNARRARPRGCRREISHWWPPGPPFQCVAHRRLDPYPAAAE